MMDKLTAVDVVSFDRRLNKKCRNPIDRKSLQTFIKQEEGKKLSEINDLAQFLPKNFCKKDASTGRQRQFECTACCCLIESTSALLAHINGDKHAKRIHDFNKKDESNSVKTDTVLDIHLTLEEKLAASSKPIVGLNFVQEFLSEKDPNTFRMYQCNLSGCSAEWGTSHEFSAHLSSRQHYESFLRLHQSETHPEKMSENELIEKVRQFSDKDFGQMETFRDESKWSQLKNRLASRPVSRLGRRKLDDVDAVAVKRVKRLPEDEPEYYFENGLRKVHPYYFTFSTHTKGRWVGERLLDVFSREFRSQPADEYRRCIENGSITINGHKVGVDYLLDHNDLLANVVHRHEVPVTDEPIKIIHQDDDLVVVDKPASIPVHPCGRYRHNTVMHILAHDHGLKNLCTVHRLDRLTSGLLLFGRHPAKARELEQQIRTRQVQKEYVCRVEGKFPETEVVCEESIQVVSYKIGVCRVSQDGKPCRTEFRRLSFNGTSSVVLCRPRTGRMHQIRVHLQFLGFPIVNDPLYNHQVFGPEKGRLGKIDKSDEQLIKDLIEIHNAENWLQSEEDFDETLAKPRVEVDEPSIPSDSSLSQYFDSACLECRMKYRDPTRKDLVMFLHASKYAGE